MILTLVGGMPMHAHAQEEDEENIEAFQEETDSSEEETESEEEIESMEEDDTASLEGGEKSDDESFEEETEEPVSLKRPESIQKKQKTFQRRTHKKTAFGSEKRGNSAGGRRNANGRKCREPKQATKFHSAFPSDVKTPSNHKKKNTPQNTPQNTPESDFEKAFKPMCVRIEKLMAQQPELAVPASVKKRCGL